MPAPQKTLLGSLESNAAPLPVARHYCTQCHRRVCKYISHGNRGMYSILGNSTQAVPSSSSTDFFFKAPLYYLYQSLKATVFKMLLQTTCKQLQNVRALLAYSKEQKSLCWAVSTPLLWSCSIAVASDIKLHSIKTLPSPLSAASRYTADGQGRWSQGSGEIPAFTGV